MWSFSRWVLWAVDRGQSSDYDGEESARLPGWHQSSHGGELAGSDRVPQLAPCDPGHLTHPTDICQQRSAATVRPQFVRLITWFAKENLPTSPPCTSHLISSPQLGFITSQLLFLLPLTTSLRPQEYFNIRGFFSLESISLELSRTWTSVIKGKRLCLFSPDSNLTLFIFFWGSACFIGKFYHISSKY